MTDLHQRAEAVEAESNQHTGGSQQTPQESQGSQVERFPYGECTQDINAGLQEMDQQQCMTNQDLRSYAKSKYAAAGFSAERIAWHMRNRSAGHIVAKSLGGGETVANKLWEDAAANHKHGSRPVNGKAAARANR